MHLRFDERNKVVMSEYEFPTMAHIWLAQEPRGAKIQFLDGINNTVPTACYEAAIDKRTRIVPLDPRGVRQRIPVRRRRDYPDRPLPWARWCFSMAIRIAARGRWT